MCFRRHPYGGELPIAPAHVLARCGSSLSRAPTLLGIGVVICFVTLERSGRTKRFNRHHRGRWHYSTGSVGSPPLQFMHYRGHRHYSTGTVGSPSLQYVHYRGQWHYSTGTVGNTPPALYGTAIFSVIRTESSPHDGYNTTLSVSAKTV